MIRHQTITDCPYECDKCKRGAECSECIDCGYAWLEENAEKEESINGEKTDTGN